MTGGGRQVGLAILRFYDFSLMALFSTASMDALHDEIWVCGRFTLQVGACVVYLSLEWCRVAPNKPHKRRWAAASDLLPQSKGAALPHTPFARRRRGWRGRRAHRCC